ncbi:MAG: PAS domain S-box protein [Nitrospirae bacterium]|nr:MAG: PAS domain S-box protein [Nitrospirota bacterium]
MKVSVLFFVMALGWTLLLAGLCLWEHREEHASAMALARTECLSAYNRDVAYRLWAARHGGVYVPITETTPPNPYLFFVPERDIKTHSGRKLTLMNPAYMTRQVHKLAKELYGGYGHITSLNPIRPENAPDEWEAKALRTFESGVQEVSSLDNIGNVTHMRLMRPLKIEAGCLECHASQGYKVGDIRGGLSVAVSWKSYQDAVSGHLHSTLWKLGGIWVIGLAGLWYSRNRLERALLQRGKAEEDLCGKEAFLITLLDAVPIPVFYKDRSGRYLGFNRAFETFFGETKERLIGKTVFDVSPPEFAEIYHAKDSELFESRGGQHYEARVKNAQGLLRDVIFNKAVFTDNQGSVSGLIGAILDITERKRAELELQESESHFRLLYERMPVPYQSLDEEGRIIEINNAWLDVFGYAREEVIGRWIGSFLTPAMADLFLERFSCFKDAGEIHCVEFDMLKKDGGIIAVAVEGRIVRDKHGGFNQTHCVLTDITERKRLEETRLAHLRFFENMDRVNRAIQGANDIEQMLGDVLDLMLSIFACDRAWLIYPCDPDAATWRVRMERTRTEYPGALAVGIDLPTTPEVVKTFLDVMNSSGPVADDPQSGRALPQVAKQFSVQSQIQTAVYPKSGKPWVLGMHQCSYARVWSGQDVQLLKEIARRAADGLSSLLFLQDLRESEMRFRTLVDQAADAIFLHDMEGRLLDVNKRACDSLGFTRDELLGRNVSEVDAEFISHNHVKNFWSELGPDHPVTLEGMHKRKDGTLFPVEVRLGLIQIKDRRVILALARDISERKRMEDALFFVAQRGCMADAENFFDALAQYLGEKLGMDYVVIDRLDENPEVAETVALYAKGAIVPNMRYALKGTPCENVMGRRLCVYPEGVQSLFPEDAMLAEMGVESYIGIPLWDSSGRPIGLIALMRRKPLPDAAPATQLLQLVATRAAAELARERSDRILRMREHEFRTLAESLPDNMGRYNREGRTVYVNPVLEKTLGVAAADMIGMSVRERHTDGSYEAYAQAVDAVLADGKDREIEFVVPVQGKQPIVHQIRMIVERDEHGEVTGVLAIGRDITESKRADASIRKLSQAVEQSPVSIVITDAAGTIEFVNAKFTQVTGYTDDEAMGKNPRILKSGETSPEQYTRLWKTISSGGIWAGEFHNRKKNGELFWEKATIAPLRNENNIITNYIAVKEDITERKKLEEQLRQAQKMEAIGTLAGGIAHDFNNILTAIKGYGYLALMKMANDDPRRLEIQYILDAGDHAAHLTNDLLLFSRKQISERKSVDLNDIIRKVQKFLKRVIGEDVECRTRLSNEAMHILGDAHQIEQVLMNFATNARDAMSAGGIFTITTERVRIDEEFICVHGYGKPDHYALTTISDTGKGMDTTTKEHIFEPFFTTKEAGKGTGLGLAVVYGIIKQHEGFINVYSEPGRGTTIKIYLPLITAHVDETISSVAEVRPIGGNETILLAEDDEAVRNMTKTVLEQFGYTVLEAGDGQEAVRMYEENRDRIHLLLFDLIMPKKTGKVAYDEIKAMSPGVKALFASGYAPDVVRQKVLLEDGLSLVLKPVTPAELLKKVRETLDKQN